MAYSHVEGGPSILWGRYSGIRVSYDPTIPALDLTDGSTGMQGIDERLSLINQAHAIWYRDTLVCELLCQLDVKALVDVGCDFGSLVAIAGSRGILARGIEPDLEGRELAKDSGLDVVPGTVQEIVNSRGEAFSKYFEQKGQPNAIACLGFTHVPREDEAMRFEFLKICVASSDYFCVSLDSSDTKRLTRDTGAQVVRRLSHRRGGFRRSRGVLEQYGRRTLPTKMLNQVMAMVHGLSPRGYIFPERIRPYASLAVVLKCTRDQ